MEILWCRPTLRCCLLNTWWQLDMEAVSRGQVVDLAFKGSVSRIGGMSLADLQREAETFWLKVCAPRLGQLG